MGIWGGKPAANKLTALKSCQDEQRAQGLGTLVRPRSLRKSWSNLAALRLASPRLASPPPPCFQVAGFVLSRGDPAYRAALLSWVARIGKNGEVGGRAEGGGGGGTK